MSRVFISKRVLEDFCMGSFLENHAMRFFNPLPLDLHLSSLSLSLSSQSLSTVINSSRAYHFHRVPLSLSVSKRDFLKVLFLKGAKSWWKHASCIYNIAFELIRGWIKTMIRAYIMRFIEEQSQGGGWTPSKKLLMFVLKGFTVRASPPPPPTPPSNCFFFWRCCSRLCGYTFSHF